MPFWWAKYYFAIYQILHLFLHQKNGARFFVYILYIFKDSLLILGLILSYISV